MSPLEAKESLVGVHLDSSRHYHKTVHHRNGTVDSEILTPTPQPHRPQTIGALRRRPVVGMTREEHLDRSLRVEAALLKGMSAATGKRIDDDKLARAVLVEVLLAMGGDWKARAAEVMGL